MNNTRSIWSDIGKPKSFHNTKAYGNKLTKITATEAAEAAPPPPTPAPTTIVLREKRSVKFSITIKCCFLLHSIVCAFVFVSLLLNDCYNGWRYLINTDDWKQQHPNNVCGCKGGWESVCMCEWDFQYKRGKENLSDMKR